MQKFFRCFLFAVAASAMASPAAARELTINIANGRATVIARDVPLRQILAEWARVGNTRMVNADKLTGGPLTIELVDIPEKDALDILLRSAAGYLTAPRRDLATGASLYDRVMILATSRPPVNTGGSPTTFPQPRTVLQQLPPQPPPDDDDDGEPGDQGPMPPPGMYPGGPPGAPGPGPNQASPFPGGPQNAPPGAQPADQPQVPFTAPRPGMLPPQPPGAGPANPYSPLNRPPGAPPAPGAPPGTRPPGGGPPDDRF